MRVKTGAVVTGRSFDIELDEVDGEMQWPEKWPQWGIAERYKRLTALADLLLVKYMVDESLYPADTGSKRLKKLSEVVNG